MPRPATRRPTRDPSSLRLLVLDGGAGSSALSQLFIVNEIVERVTNELGRKNPPLPCELWDHITGSGPGGIAALLLGRLRLSAERAIEAYIQLCHSVASSDCGRARNTQSLRETFLGLMKDVGMSPNTKMLQGTASCKVVVVASPAANCSHSRRFANYRSKLSFNPGCTVLDAALATCASPDIFKAVSVAGERFVDGTFTSPNPVKEAIQEAVYAFGDNAQASLVLSIGAGRDRIISVSDLVGRGETRLQSALRSIALECQRVHEHMYSLFGGAEAKEYIRLDVQRGLESQGQKRGKTWAGTVKTHTCAYLSEGEVVDMVDRVARRLARKEREAISLHAMTTGVETPHIRNRRGSSSSSSSQRSTSADSDLTLVDDPNGIESDDDDGATVYGTNEDNDEKYSYDLFIGLGPAPTPEDEMPHWSRWILDPVGFGFPLLAMATIWFLPRISTAASFTA